VPDVLLMVATELSEELQVTREVISCVVLPEKLPVALNCCVPPTARLSVDGFRVRELRVAEETVRVVLEETLP